MYRTESYSYHEGWYKSHMVQCSTQAGFKTFEHPWRICFQSLIRSPQNSIQYFFWAHAFHSLANNEAKKYCDCTTGIYSVKHTMLLFLQHLQYTTPWLLYRTIHMSSYFFKKVFGSFLCFIYQKILCLSQSHLYWQIYNLQFFAGQSSYMVAFHLPCSWG